MNAETPMEAPEETQEPGLNEMMFVWSEVNTLSRRALVENIKATYGRTNRRERRQNAKFCRKAIKLGILVAFRVDDPAEQYPEEGAVVTVDDDGYVRTFATGDDDD